MRAPALLGILSLALIIGLDGSGCGTDDGGKVLDAGLMPCDVPATFTALYTQIFSQPDTPASGKLCAQASGCHASTFTSGNLDMSGDKAAVYNLLLRDPTADPVAARTVPSRVKPNDPMGSFLYRKVADARPPGIGDRMPLGGVLTKCQIDAIKAWIDAGGLND